MLVYGGMPLADNWMVTDFPQDALKMELWDRVDTVATAKQEAKDDEIKRAAEVEASAAAIKQFESGLCDEQSRTL